MKNNAYIEENDPFILTVLDEQLATDMFGPDYLEDFGQVVPQDLIDRFKKNYIEFLAIQKELRAIKARK